jgi:hypothetical protein
MKGKGTSTTSPKLWAIMLGIGHRQVPELLRLPTVSTQPDDITKRLHEEIERTPPRYRALLPPGRRGRGAVAECGRVLS